VNTPLRVVLFGASGQVGTRLVAALDAAGYDVTALDRARCDFLNADEKKIETIVRAVEPAFIINAAAYTDVDGAERNPADALRINADIPKLLAHIAHGHAIPFLHFSTDYVFGGTGRAPYAVDAPMQPVNVYGASKLAGEEAVLAAAGYVLRLQWVYDLQGKSFCTAMQKLLAERGEIRVVADQLGAPTCAFHIAQAVTQALLLILNRTLPAGAYHLATDGFTSWHGFACAIARAMQSHTRIIPIIRGEYRQAAARPSDTRLDCSALAAYGIALPHWHDAFTALWKDAHAHP
jgi:dTDP-4-dehydrorhamnose reductase